MAVRRAVFFFLLAHLEAASLLILAMGSAAMKASHALLETDLCFDQPGTIRYPVGGRLNKINCALNTIFQAAGLGPRAVQLQMMAFGGLFVSLVAIMTYEGFRPVHKRSSRMVGALARASSLFLLLGQRVTAGFSSPLQLVFSTWSTTSGLKKGANTDEEKLALLVPEAKHIWVTLASTALGYVLPTLVLQKQKFSYTSLSIWQPFPVYMLALNIMFPKILAAAPSRAAATTLLAALCTVGSITAHAEVLRDTIFATGPGAVSLLDVFLLRAQPDTASLAHAAHRIFVIDFFSVLITTAALAATTRRRAGRKAKTAFARLAASALITIVAGPGAGVIIPWAAGELALQREYKTARKATNGATKVKKQK